MQSARELPQLRSPLVPVAPKLAFRWERFSGLAKELAPLFLEHWREIALNQDDVPLDPDYDKYLNCELAGLLHVLAARAEGQLVGYIICLAGPHLHYASTPWCMVDLIYLQPAFRVGWNGVRLMKRFEAGMVKLGVKVIHIAEKLHFSETHEHHRKVGALFEFLGYNPIEQVYAKRIG